MEIERNHKCSNCNKMFTHIGIGRHEKVCGRFTSEDLISDLENNEMTTLSSLAYQYGRSTTVIKEFLEGTAWEGAPLMKRGRIVKRIRDQETLEENKERTQGKRDRLREEGWKKCPVCELLITLKQTICKFCIEDGRTLEDAPEENKYLLKEDGLL